VASALATALARGVEALDVAGADVADGNEARYAILRESYGLSDLRCRALAAIDGGPYEVLLTSVLVEDLFPEGRGVSLGTRRHIVPILMFLGFEEREAEETLQEVAHIEPVLVAAAVSRSAAIDFKAALEDTGICRVSIRERPPPVRGAREPIPEHVRHEVWRRDQGACVDCGSRDRLHFDHIVPVSRGGSNTARNIELRCETCNLRKGARI